MSVSLVGIQRFWVRILSVPGARKLICPQAKTLIAGGLVHLFEIH